MANIITITLPPNTTVVLPADDSFSASSSTIYIDNQSGATISLGSAGSASGFTVGTVPATIASGSDDDIDLTTLGGGDLVFDDGPSDTTVTISPEAPPTPPGTSLWQPPSGSPTIGATTGGIWNHTRRRSIR